MLLLRLLAYIFPVWGILYVFYWVPRKNYTTKHDVVLHDTDIDLIGADPDGL